MQKLLTALKHYRPSPAVLVLSTYLLLLLSRFLDTSMQDPESTYLSVVALQMMIFLLPAAIWIRAKGDGYTARLRLRPGKAETLLLALAAALLLAVGGLLLSILFAGLGNLPSTFTLYETFLSRSDGTLGGVLYLILAYAALPAICEELVFRSILSAEYEHGGTVLAILASSLFFSLLHFNFTGIPVYFFAGIVLSLTMYISRSVLPAMLAHFLYNLFGIFGQPYISTFYSITGSRVLFTFLLVFLLLLSAALFCGGASRLFRLYADRNLPHTEHPDVLPENRTERYLSVLLCPDAIAAYAVWLTATLLILLL